MIVFLTEDNTSGKDFLEYVIKPLIMERTNEVVNVETARGKGNLPKVFKKLFDPKKSGKYSRSNKSEIVLVLCYDRIVATDYNRRSMEKEIDDLKDDIKAIKNGCKDYGMKALIESQWICFEEVFISFEELSRLIHKMNTNFVKLISKVYNKNNNDTRSKWYIKYFQKVKPNDYNKYTLEALLSKELSEQAKNVAHLGISKEGKVDENLYLGYCWTDKVNKCVKAKQCKNCNNCGMPILVQQGKVNDFYTFWEYIESKDVLLQRFLYSIEQIYK